MTPYKIVVTWADYDPTNTEDMYKVEVYDTTQKYVIHSWVTTKRALGISIDNYLSKLSSI